MATGMGIGNLPHQLLAGGCRDKIVRLAFDGKSDHTTMTIPLPASAQRRAQLVLRWGTALETRVLSFSLSAS